MDESCDFCDGKEIHVKRVKKISAVLMSILMIAATAVTGCGSSGNKQNTETDSARSEAVASSADALASSSSGTVTDSTEAVQSVSSSSSAMGESVTPSAGSADTSEADMSDAEEVDGYIFQWSGGSGRAVITCQQVSEQDGQMYATIHFARANGGTSAYTQVKSLGQTVTGDNTFSIPVNIDENTPIQALTTAMSQPHWIDYVLYIAKSDGSNGADGVSPAGDSLDDTAPAITGLTAKDDEDESDVHSDLVRLFSYEDDVWLIEVDMVKDTARENTDGEKTSSAGEANEASDSAEMSAVFGDAEETAGDAATDEGSASSVYMKKIVRYLVVPEAFDVPAGLDKQMVIIRRPVDKAFIASPDALETISSLGRTDDIVAVGMDAQDIADDAVKTALNKKDGEDGKIYQAGTSGDWDLKTLILQKADLAIESSSVLPKNAETAEQDMQAFEKMISHAEQMDMPLFVDRSADETDELAKADWYRVYGVIFDAEDMGETHAD